MSSAMRRRRFEEWPTKPPAPRRIYQDIYGQARDTAADAAGAARDTAASFEKWLRRTIETQPYTAAMVALGVGWLFGRMHRPL